MALTATQVSNTITVKVNVQENGTNLALANPTNVSMILSDETGTRYIKKTATVTDASTGEISLTVARDDLVAAGVWSVQVEYTDGTFQGRTEVKEFRVEPNIRSITG